MKTIEGDLINLAKQGKFDVIIHGCNCFCTMGAGIAKQIKSQYYEAYQADCKTKVGDRNKLGTYTQYDNGTFVIVNAYTQYDFHTYLAPPIDYEALREVFKTIKQDFSGLRIGYPKIGAGLAGGNWELISSIIDEELDGEDHTVVIYNG